MRLPALIQVSCRDRCAAPAPAQPRVIQYPGGRYELRGDGIATAYEWVWIPNPTNLPSSPGAPSAYSAPAPTYSTPPAPVQQTSAAPAPAQPTVFQYPHGRYELRAVTFSQVGNTDRHDEEGFDAFPKEDDERR